MASSAPMTARELAAGVEPRLDAFSFSFPWLRDELERIEPGAGARGWAVLELLDLEWARLGWRALADETDASR